MACELPAVVWQSFCELLLYTYFTFLLLLCIPFCAVILLGVWQQGHQKLVPLLLRLVSVLGWPMVNNIHRYIGHSISRLPESTVMRPSAAMAPENTSKREWRIARIAAMKNVLSPSSDTMMTDSDATNAWTKLASITGADVAFWTNKSSFR